MKALLTLLALTLLCACTRTVYVPAETTRTEWRDRDVERVITDTVHDMRVVWVKGDTIMDVRERNHIRRIEVHDTCYVLRTDSVAVPYPVERMPSRWERAKSALGWGSAGAVLCLLCVALIRFRRSWRHRRG